MANPIYPVYIISKGRASNPITYNRLKEMGVPCRIVIEPQEANEYLEHVEASDILLLPFENLGQGSIPARNWVWEHSVSIGAKRHWILDDNIKGFERLNRNERATVTSGTIFKCAEDFVDRYENVAIAGFEYRQFAGGARRKKGAFRLNTRVYSCILIKNDIPYRWRGKYNEDTDLSIRALKDGWCTVLFQCFLQNKASTMSMKGGNTDTIYNTGDNRREFAESLAQQHPDVAKVVFRYGRWHHDIDYDPFKDNELVKKSNLPLFEGIDNYGMRLVKEGERHV